MLWNLNKYERDWKIFIDSGVQGRLKISRWKSWFLLQLSLLGMPEHKSFHFDLFCQFLLEYVWWWTSAPILHKLALCPRGVLLFLMSFIGYWCSIQYIKLLAVFIQAEPCLVWWFMFHLLLIPLSRDVESIFVHLFCPEHAFFAPHQSCHKPLPFYNTLKCLPLLARGKCGLWLHDHLL